MGLVLKELMAILVNFLHQEKESFIAQKEGYQKNRPRKKGNMSCLRVQGKSDNYSFGSTICLLLHSFTFVLRFFHIIMFYIHSDDDTKDHRLKDDEDRKNEDTSYFREHNDDRYA
jgi:hypothetical protein